jgi:choline dehydrogenase-like flavoprotein
MIEDARRLDAAGPVECDVCVVGGGPAGIAVALEVAGAGRSVCLLEAGGLAHEPRSQALLAGETAGSPYPPLAETRCARLGGATGVWAGWCRPLDAIDFEARDWIPGSGWPFPREEILPYLARAHLLCGLGPPDYDPAAWEARTGTARLPLGAGFEAAIFHVRPLRFGDAHRAALGQAAGIRVLLHAVALRLERAGDGGRIARLRAGTLDGRRFDVAARRYVLAAGGIENARLLLLSGESPEQAIGNARGLVGRYFMEHGFVNAGSFVPRDPASSLAFHQPFVPAAGAQGAALRAVIALGAAAQREVRLANGALFFHPAYESHAAFDSPEVRALLEIGNALRGRAVPGGLARRAARALRAPGKLATAAYRKLAWRGAQPARWRTRALFECAPERGNRVTLAGAKDAFGRPLARLEWRLGERDLASAMELHRRFDAALHAAGLGHYEFRLPAEAAAWREAVEGGKHHLGTTRMHADPGQGVVDPDARVHGSPNLYVAGSSVFPAGGYANPTLTLVALAVRLGRHLAEEAR